MKKENNIEKIGLGGGCHWCTEGVFQSLIGVEKVEQGWIASTNENSSLSEAVIVHFNPQKISLDVLIEIHLLTHSSTNLHKRRDKYRSAVYSFFNEQHTLAQQIIKNLQSDFDEKIITKVLPFESFKLNIEEQLNYFYQNQDKPFCQTYIQPKLNMLMQKHSTFLNKEKLKNLKVEPQN